MTSLPCCEYNQIDKMSKIYSVDAGRLSQCYKISTDSSLNYYLIILFWRKNSQADNKKNYFSL